MFIKKIWISVFLKLKKCDTHTTFNQQKDNFNKCNKYLINISSYPLQKIAKFKSLLTTSEGRYNFYLKYFCPILDDNRIFIIYEHKLIMYTLPIRGLFSSWIIGFAVKHKTSVTPIIDFGDTFSKNIKLVENVCKHVGTSPKCREYATCLHSKVCHL